MRNALWWIGLTAVALGATALDARAQSGPPVTAQAEPAAPPIDVIRKVPKLSVSFGGGVTRIDNFYGPITSPSLVVGVVMPVHRHFALEFETGHFSGRRSFETPAQSFDYGGDPSRHVIEGPITYQETMDVWYGAASLTGRLDLGRVLLWAGAGITFGTDTGESSTTYSSCSAPALPGYCDHAVSYTSPRSSPLGGRFSGGVEVGIGRGVRVFASASTSGIFSNSYAFAVFQTGLRVPVVSTTEVMRAPMAAASQVRIATRDGDWPGHIAGARSVPFSEMVDDQLKLKSPEELAEIFTKAGVQPGDTIVGYCHIGQQATEVLFAARTLGHPVLLYDGSFEDWSRHADYPVDNPARRPVT